MATGLEKYLVNDNQQYVDAAKSVLYDAEKYEAKTLSKKGWELLKNLICEDKHFKAIIDTIQDAYITFNKDVKLGKISAEDQTIVKRQVELTNNMVRAAVKELEQEGRVTLSESSKNKKYKIENQNKKLANNEEENSLILK